MLQDRRSALSHLHWYRRPFRLQAILHIIDNRSIKTYLPSTILSNASQTSLNHTKSSVLKRNQHEARTPTCFAHELCICPIQQPRYRRRNVRERSRNYSYVRVHARRMGRHIWVEIVDLKAYRYSATICRRPKTASIA